MTVSCRSSAGCEQPATHGTLGAYLCESHFQEIDLIRRTWFTADGAPLRKARDPDDAPLSIGEVADQVTDAVRAVHPRPLGRGELRRALNLPQATVLRAATIASQRRRVVSTNAGYVLADAD